MQVKNISKKETFFYLKMLEPSKYPESSKLEYLENFKIFKQNFPNFYFVFIYIIVSCVIYVQLQISCNLPLKGSRIVPKKWKQDFIGLNFKLKEQNKMLLSTGM